MWDALRTMRASFVQEVAEVEKSVSRCQELQESLQEKRHTQAITDFPLLEAHQII